MGHILEKTVIKIRPVQLQILSGWHPENGSRIWTPRAPYLCLLGNMGIPFTSAYQDVIARGARYHEKVFVVPGASEYSGERGWHDPQRLSMTDAFLERLSRTYTNVHLMQTSSLLIRENILLAGSTMRLGLTDRRYTDHYAHCWKTFKEAESHGRRLVYLTYQAPHWRHLKPLNVDPDSRILLQGVSCDNDRLVTF